MSKDILYTPNLKPSKHYDTIGRLNTTIDEQLQLDIENITPSSNIEKLQEDIDIKIEMLPEALKATYLTPYYLMKKEYTSLAINNKDKESITVDLVEEDKEPEDTFPDFFSKSSDIYIEKDDPNIINTDTIEDQYYTDFLEIYEDYLKNISDVSNNFSYTTLNLLNNKYAKNIQDSYATKDLTNESIYHASDYMTKSDIRLEQLLRLHEKLFDADETIMHIKSIKVSKEQMKRYFEIEPKEQEDEIDTFNNVLLEESRRVSQKKYEDNLYSLYKYLNSSVILMNETANILAKQNKCMITINKYE